MKVTSQKATHKSLWRLILIFSNHISNYLLVYWTGRCSKINYFFPYFIQMYAHVFHRFSYASILWITIIFMNTSMSNWNCLHDSTKSALFILDATWILLTLSESMLLGESRWATFFQYVLIVVIHGRPSALYWCLLCANKQTTIRLKSRKWSRQMVYGDSNKRTFNCKLITLNQKLKAVSENGQLQERISKRKKII